MVFIIIGILLFLFIGFIFLAVTLALKNEENWESFYKQLSESGNPLPEEEAYRMACKVKTFTLVGMLISIGIIILGIALVVR